MCIPYLCLTDWVLHWLKIKAIQKTATSALVNLIEKEILYIEKSHYFTPFKITAS